MQFYANGKTIQHSQIYSMHTKLKKTATDTWKKIITKNNFEIGSIQQINITDDYFLGFKNDDVHVLYT